LSGEEFEEDDAHVENIGPFVDVTGFDSLFGGHVERCALHVAATGQSAGNCLLSAADELIDFVIIAQVGDLGQPPVEHHDFAVVSDHDIGRFHIAVYDAVVMSEGEALCALDEHLQQLWDGVFLDGGVVIFGDAVEDIAEVATAKLLHGEVGIAFGVAAEFVDGYCAGVGDLCRDASFAEEAFLVGFEVLKLRLQRFHDDGASEIFVDAGSEYGFAALCQGLEVPIPHEAVFHVLRQIPIGICHVDVVGHSEILRKPAMWYRDVGGG